jgi:S-adenosylmethionine synthetase
MQYHSFASESVCAGHPDKICDQISDAIVDAALKAEPFSRVAVETMVTKNQVSLAGEVTCPRKLDYPALARQVIKDLGYTRKIYQFTTDSPIDVFIHQQSAAIAQGVDQGGAGDQGMMFGYAVNETPELMPLPIVLAHHLTQAIDQARIKKTIPYLRPDGKAEVVVEYRHGRPVNVSTVIIAVPHQPKISNKRLKQDLKNKVVDPVLSAYCLSTRAYRLIINGTGHWLIGGPASDTGVTGRKIIVDTYGAMARHGGGCFSGKDPTKVDRSGAYACRFLAKNIVAQGLADRCEVKVAYVIGQAKPVARAIETFGTEKRKLSLIKDFAFSLLDLSVPQILNRLNLRRPIYLKTASYGHFGRDGFPWEQLIDK